MADGRELRTLSGHQDEVISVSFSPDGKTVASASSDKTIKLWNVADGKELRTLSRHQAAVWGVSFSPDGKTVASASIDRTIKLWSVEDGKELRTFSGHQAAVRGVSFSPDGKMIASASYDKTIKLWNWDFDRLMVMGCDRIRPYLISSVSDLETLPVCQTPQTLQLASDHLVTESENLEQEKQFEAAIDRLNQAIQLQPDLAPKLSPKIAELDSQARLAEEKQREEARLAEGKQLKDQGEIPEAIAIYTEVEKLNPDLISAQSWNSLCWQGSMFGHAAEVIDACNKAVAPNPNDGGIRDSRGLARALNGDAKGAIEDFRVYIQNNGSHKSQRQRWIDVLEKWLSDPKQTYPFTYEALKAGRSPFQRGELEELKRQ